MATTKPTTDFDPNADVTQAPDDWNWETVRDEAPTTVIFEKPGEEFVGQFVRKMHVDREPNAKGEDQSFDLFVFKGRDGKPYALSNSYALVEGYEDELFKAGDWCKLTYVKDIDRGTGKNAMKDIAIAVRR